MKPPPFLYACPDTLDEALALLAEHGDEAKVLAGGQSLVPLLSFRLARPTVLVDINRVAGLDRIDVTDGEVRFGSTVRERAAERSADVGAHAPMVAAALPFIGHEAIRTRGTIGGSIAHADPAAELPAVALAMDAELVATSASGGERAIPAADFFQGFFTTALEPEEILTEVRIPRMPAATGVAVEEMARRHGDFAMVGAVVALTVADGSIAAARVALLNVSDAPVRAREAEEALVGASPTDETFRAAADLAVRDLEPASDLHATGDYRRRVAATLIRRALTRATAESQEAS